ncbi:hypothetical protein BHE74_00011602 [Ensete ventricosum]|nr:hypothetical protein GW17_00005474 [Ensete ventricosum]RWW80074.1 hypothetical protein BHE74_00011602 [Ensete ventricosum]RZR82150.1 hypothetical protein BHM03_00008514 [Ensete ventricosum]
MGIGYNGYDLWLEGCPKDYVIGGSKIGRVLVGCEKKNDKGKGNVDKKFVGEYDSKEFGKIKEYEKVLR